MAIMNLGRHGGGVSGVKMAPVRLLLLLLLPAAAPLEVLWNAPYPQACRADPSAFARDASRWGLTVNGGAAANGAAIYTIGQGEGLYPRFGLDGAPINGGLPQLADVERQVREKEWGENSLWNLV